MSRMASKNSRLTQISVMSVTVFRIVRTFKNLKGKLLLGSKHSRKRSSKRNRKRLHKPLKLISRRNGQPEKSQKIDMKKEKLQTKGIVAEKKEIREEDHQENRMKVTLALILPNRLIPVLENHLEKTPA